MWSRGYSTTIIGVVEFSYWTRPPRTARERTRPIIGALLPGPTGYLRAGTFATVRISRGGGPPSKDASAHTTSNAPLPEAKRVLPPVRDLGCRFWKGVGVGDGDGVCCPHTLRGVWVNPSPHGGGASSGWDVVVDPIGPPTPGGGQFARRPLAFVPCSTLMRALLV